MIGRNFKDLTDMREIQELTVEKREGTGKGPSYQTRQKGQIPAIIYGGSSDPEPIALDAHTLTLAYEKGAFLTTLLKLNDGAKVTRVIPRDLQLDPVTDRPVHVDFMRLEEGATIKLEIPLHFKGTEVSPGVKKGGVLNIVRHSLELICPADNIPSAVDIDVSKMDLRDSLHINDIALPEGVVPTTRFRDFTLASIVAPTSVKEDRNAPAADAAAPAAAAPAAGAKAAAPAAGAKAAPAAAKAPAKK
ncbi:large subunit ribosomal protein L25 [Rhizomicrobium palustre]|uniref:Large ribosomal subunit protein bL25 n=2 Tax=Rhizomicrobium palustre TaxID=189966 RepID=A0A846MXG5_9PROT|nr:large subunit ribosomal protein L25 [Rhizomicrobium palustre]